MGERGWNLLELLICMALLSLVALLAMPRFQLVERQLDYEAACLVAELRFLQIMSHDHPRDVLWGVPGKPIPGLRMGRNSYVIFSGGTYMMEHNAKYGAHYGYPRDVIYFNQSGETEPLTIRIYLLNSSRQVIVDRVGRIRTAGGS